MRAIRYYICGGAIQIKYLYFTFFAVFRNC